MADDPYLDVIFDQDNQRWTSSAEVDEVPFTAFSLEKKAKQIPGRLVVRRILELNNKQQAQPGLFDWYRLHVVFTTAASRLLDTVAADKIRRSHAMTKQVNADLKASTLAHLSSGVFTANTA